jgi:hypothetical protein
MLKICPHLLGKLFGFATRGSSHNMGYMRYNHSVAGSKADGDGDTLSSTFPQLLPVLLTS